jgi:hypothetical protein
MLEFHVNKKKKPCKLATSLDSPDKNEESDEKISKKKNVLKNKETELPQNKETELPQNKEIELEDTEPSSLDNQCYACGRQFTRIDSLKRHREGYCKNVRSTHEKSHLEEELILLKRKMQEIEKNDQKHQLNFEQLRQQPQIVNNTNQFLQILCVRDNQNYLEMLSEKWGDYDRALEFIKDCALSSLTGDCKLLGKIYFCSENPAEHPIKYADKSRKNLEYLNDRKEKIIDPQGLKLAKILANNLQNSYLQGVNYLVEQTLKNNQYLNDYDIQNWNNHIYELSDSKYQRKIISTLDIPS